MWCVSPHQTEKYFLGKNLIKVVLDCLLLVSFSTKEWILDERDKHLKLTWTPCFLSFETCLPEDSAGPHPTWLITFLNFLFLLNHRLLESQQTCYMALSLLCMPLKREKVPAYSADRVLKNTRKSFVFLELNRIYAVSRIIF